MSCFFRPAPITVGEAEMLLRKALEGSGMTKLPEFGLTNFPRSPAFFSRWYLFTGTWAGPPQRGSVITGNWAVDKRTGEVWNGVICEELESPALMRLQKAIRKRIGLSTSDYWQIRVDGPLCEPKPEK
jgi:hypothetical protein